MQITAQKFTVLYIYTLHTTAVLAVQQHCMAKCTFIKIHFSLLKIHLNEYSGAFYSEVVCTFKCMQHWYESACTHKPRTSGQLIWTYSNNQGYAMNL